VKTLQEVLGRAKQRPLFEVAGDDVSVPEMIAFVRGHIARIRGERPLSATRLLEEQHSRRAMICLFLAILELVKRQAVELVQGEAFGDIGLRRGLAFEDADDSAELAAVEEEYH
jgi:segregation and condensation protein A